MTFMWAAERGVIIQFADDGKQILWERSRLPTIWRPADLKLDRWWLLVGNQEP